MLPEQEKDLEAYTLDPEEVKRVMEMMFTPPQKKRNEQSSLEAYWKLRRKVEEEEEKMFRLMRMAKRAKRPRIRKKNKARFVKQGKKVIKLYEQMKKMEQEAEKNGKVIECPYFVGRGCI